MTFNTLDLIILGVIGISSIFGLFRGFSSSFLSLFTWIFALWLPFRFTDEFKPFLPPSVESPEARTLVAALVLFFGAFIILSTIGFLLKKLLGATGLGPLDRLMGVGLGVVRGALIVSLVAMLASSTFSSEPWWAESRLMPPVLLVSDFIRDRMPDDLSRMFIVSRL